MISEILIGLLILVALYFLSKYLLKLFSRIFPSYPSWYKNNHQKLQPTNEELPGFGQWARSNQKKAFIIFVVILLVGLILLMFIE